jgi:hypothetical protein
VLWKSLFALAEAYPNLKANENFLQLQEELTNTESKIAYARQFYNDSVMSLNTAIQSFPANLLAGMFGFTGREYFEICLRRPSPKGPVLRSVALHTAAAIAFPAIDPVALRLGPIAVRWYGLAYLLGFAAAAVVLFVLAKRWALGLTGDDILNIVLAAIIGVVVGGRLGYVLFYGNGFYWEQPLRILRIWDGGMSFHGGLLGILVAGLFAARIIGMPWLTPGIQVRSGRPSVGAGRSRTSSMPSRGRVTRCHGSGA